MTEFLNKSFSVGMAGDQQYRDNWEATFGAHGRATACCYVHRKDWASPTPSRAQDYVPCPRCDGTAFKDDVRCIACNGSGGVEAIVWADDASPFTGAQVKSLLDENERLRNESKKPEPPCNGIVVHDPMFPCPRCDG